MLKLKGWFVKKNSLFFWAWLKKGLKAQRLELAAKGLELLAQKKAKRSRAIDAFIMRKT